MPQAQAKPYEFVEYPKHVTIDGKVIVCNDEDEEAQALASGKVVREEDERARMIAVADLYEIKVDKRWGLDKMAKAIRDAGHDPEHDPSK